MSHVPSPADPPRLAEADQRVLGKLAARALARTCAGLEDEDGSPPAPLTPGLERMAGVFVTLFSEDELRGCIGATRALAPLWREVPRLTRAAAASDRRFPAVTAEELPSLGLEITVLGELLRLPPNPSRVLQCLRPPTHGACVRAGARSGLLLPQVARRYGWSASELLEQTCRKAGLPRDGWRSAEAELFAFTAVSFAFDSKGDPLAAGEGLA